MTTSYAAHLNETDRVVATLKHKLAIAEARSTWGTKKQRTAETEAAAKYRARLRELGH